MGPNDDSAHTMARASSAPDVRHGEMAVSALGSASDPSKCRHVYVGLSVCEFGGPRSGAGMSTSTSTTTTTSPPRPCSHLRCTSCDFEVLRWADAAWTSDAEYMFFRNNMPSRAKLESRLTRSEGSSAYCCQCSWVTASPAAGTAPGSGGTVHIGVVLVRKSGIAVQPSAAGAEAQRACVRLTHGGHGWSFWACAGHA